MGIWGGDRSKIDRLQTEMPLKQRGKFFSPLKLNSEDDKWRHDEHTEVNREASIEELKWVRISSRSSLGNSDQSAIDAQISDYGEKTEQI